MLTEVDEELYLKLFGDLCLPAASSSSNTATQFGTLDRLVNVFLVRGHQLLRKALLTFLH